MQVERVQDQVVFYSLYAVQRQPLERTEVFNSVIFVSFLLSQSEEPQPPPCNGFQ